MGGSLSDPWSQIMMVLINLFTCSLAIFITAFILANSLNKENGKAHILGGTKLFFFLSFSAKN